MNIEDKRKIKVGIIIAAFTVAFFLLLNNFDSFSAFCSKFIGIFSPFIYGICFGFIINSIMRFLEEKAFKKLNSKPVWKKLKRPVCLTLSVLVVIGILAALLSFVLPQLIDSASKLMENSSAYINGFTQFANNLLGRMGMETDIVGYINQVYTTFSDKVIGYITSSLPQLADAAKGLTSGIVNIVMGFVIGIYMASMKEKLILGCKRAVYAFLPQKAADYIRHVYKLVNKRFSGFVTGQLTEAFILALLCFIGMSIFQMDYPLLISVIIGSTNIIPMFGAWIGGIVGALITLIVNPPMAIWFLIFLIVLQQIESNLIYPKVVGDSIGLSAIWVIFAVVVGGALFGFAGIVLGVPSFAVLYNLLSEAISNRLEKKKLKLS